jgi:hypothetical protein
MGQILRTKTLPSGKIIFYLELTMQETRELKNHAKKIHLFSENLCVHEAKIISRGVKHGAKSVAIPLSLKSRFNPKLTEMAYQKIETDKKIFYIATAKKDPLSS